MLARLSIQNIALIEELTVTLDCGLNILSGETGAGKSIIIDSLNFVLGERADKSLISNGKERATVEAVFEDYLTPEVSAILEELGIDAEDILILRRSMTESKNECRINGAAVTLSMLRAVSEKLVDIHGQHEHQSLLKVSSHMGLLDAYGGEGIFQKRAEVAALHKEYKSYIREYAKFGDADERARRIDILNYQIDELKKADLKEGEEDELLSERRRFRNSEKILNAVADAEGLLDGFDSGFSVISALNKAINLLNIAGGFDEKLLPLLDRIESSKIELKDVADSLKESANDLRYDDFAAENVEKRLEIVRTVSRKYGGTVTAANEFLEKAVAEFEMLSHADESCAVLEKNINECGKRLLIASTELHNLRKKFAKSFIGEIDAQLHELGMPGARFDVEFSEVDEEVTPDNCGDEGFDRVEFMISANKGEPLKPLVKIISGGEMSRFMLALKNITARLDGIQTMVFDEIDTGISGAIAQVVAEKLYNIGATRQVIAVTHLPQLASMADMHYKIEKHETDVKTVTTVTLLDDNGQLSEIARLIGGSTYSSHAIPHADEMKKHANAYKLKK